MDLKDLEQINALLEEDIDTREGIKSYVTELDKYTRAMTGLLGKIHSTPSAAIPKLLESVKPIMESCVENRIYLSDAVPPNQFWRWKDMWANSLRSIVFSAALMEYLTSGSLITIHRVESILNIQPEEKGRFSLPPEDYLHGIINMVNELSRLAVNAVTLGNFEEPIRISIFVKDIFAGFSMLNLKNDALRRRFDSLKYDIKKIEEVLYDVSLRRLAPSAPKPGAEDSK
ncbi:Translin [Schizophyllum fasciatum]